MPPAEDCGLAREPADIVSLATQQALVDLTEAVVAAVDAGARTEHIDKAVHVGRSIARR